MINISKVYCLFIVTASILVDKVVPQENMDKFSAWEKLKFEAIFVGDDWKGTQKWLEYEKQFASVGVEIIYFLYTTGTSSTKLRCVLDKILE